MALVCGRSWPSSGAGLSMSEPFVRLHAKRNVQLNGLCHGGGPFNERPCFGTTEVLDVSFVQTENCIRLLSPEPGVKTSIRFSARDCVMKEMGLTLSFDALKSGQLGVSR
jgi:hypothetical protein